MGEKKPNLTLSERVKQLEEEIEYNKNYLLKTSDESEKQKCRKMIAWAEEELRKLKGSSNSSKDRGETTNSNSSSSNNNSDDKSDKDEKISQLQAEIEQLKNQNSSANTPQ